MVGIYKQVQLAGKVPSTGWPYTPGTSGAVTFKANYGRGTDQAYYLYNNGYTILAGPLTITLK